MVRKTVRMLYKEPIVVLIVDFIMKYQIAEANVIAYKHNIVQRTNKHVTTELNKLRDDGILT